jgi:hypothetical protein|tara:strand:- start:7474 stop:7746 length:273 start_codon:yes stop_codon:yes gene_type:complete
MQRTRRVIEQDHAETFGRRRWYHKKENLCRSFFLKKATEFPFVFPLVSDLIIAAGEPLTFIFSLSQTGLCDQRERHAVEHDKVLVDYNLS